MGVELLKTVAVKMPLLLEGPASASPAWLVTQAPFEICKPFSHVTRPRRCALQVSCSVDLGCSATYEIFGDKSLRSGHIQ